MQDYVRCPSTARLPKQSLVSTVTAEKSMCVCSLSRVWLDACLGWLDRTADGNGRSSEVQYNASGKK